MWRVRVVVQGYVLDDDPARVDVDAAWAFLSTEAYWGRWRTRDVLAAQIASAWRVVGSYTEERGDMVGFGRAFSDGAATAYLADVYVLADHRGRGLATALLKLMIEDGPGVDFRWMLHTSDAHGLYAKAGFGPPNASYLERPGPPSRAPLPPGT